MSQAESHKIRFRITGRAFNEGSPIHLVSKALKDLQGILDKPYLHIEKKGRLSRQDRSSFLVLVSSMRQGSFVADLEIIYQASQVSFPFVATLGPQAVWGYATETWKFLKLIFERAKNGESRTPVIVRRTRADR